MISKHLGYVTIRIPITEITESESWEIPQKYTYLEVGKSELIEHDIPERYHEWVLISNDEIYEHDIALGGWTREEVTKTHTPSDAPIISSDLPFPELGKFS
jgi:hypothetical protein